MMCVVFYPRLVPALPLPLPNFLSPCTYLEPRAIDPWPVGGHWGRSLVSIYLISGESNRMYAYDVGPLSTTVVAVIKDIDK